MKAEDSVARRTERALALLAEKRSETVFNDLLSYASEVCLVHPPHYLSEKDESKYTQVTPEEKLVQSLGARSLSTLLEIKAGIHPPLPPAEPADDSSPGYIPHKHGFHISELVSEPDMFSEPLNLRILENIEQFGQALINESFAVLGKNAEVWAAKLKNAGSKEEELAVITWLEARIRTIGNRSRSESSQEDEDAHFYPPFRISPKFIGTYPHVALQPSCLSTSIIATSFFEKAGKPTLHAGVMAPTQDTGSELLAQLFAHIAEQENESRRSEREELLAHIISMAKVTKKWATRPLAQHGAVYAKLQSGWWQIDTYGDATAQLLSVENEHLDVLHENLTDWHHVVPNLEFTTSVTPELDLLIATPEHSALSILLGKYEYGDAAEELIAHINKVLLNIPEESYETYLLFECLGPLLNRKYNRFAQQGEDNEKVLGSLLSAANAIDEFKDGYSTAIRESFNKTLNKFIFWGASAEEFKQRCTNDPEYRQRRAEDFLTAPMLMGVYLAKAVAESNPHYAHMSVDIGSPAMRIGLAVLSDFARYDDHPLPASFWITHWPGAASAHENIDNPPASRRDWALLYNALVAQTIHPFATLRNYDKINSFLSANREEDQDGNEPG